MKNLTPPQFKKGDRQILTGVQNGAVHPNIILAVRDPLGFSEDAAAVIAKKLERPELVSDTGMFVTYNGFYKGVPITVCSTGSGAPDTEIAIVELLGATRDKATIIRIGTSGSAHPSVEVGDLIITTAAVRSEGTSAAYAPTEFPAVADFDVVSALTKAARTFGFRHQLGITRSTDSIYCGQGRPALGFAPPGLESVASDWARLGVLNYERETSVILALGSILGYRAGSVCAVVNSAITGEVDTGAGVDEAIQTGLEALVPLPAH
jgi:uridine phosphorylase